MQQKAIVHSENISRRGELKYFQIPLQGTSIKIIAVEVSASIFSTGNSTSNSSQNLMAAALSTTDESVEVIGGDGGGGGGGSGSTGDSTGGGSGSSGTVNTCPNPGTASIDSVSDTVANNIRSQVFRIGAAVNPTFVYSCGVYSVSLSVTAIDGDTPSSIASKLAAAVNNTSLAEWNQFGSNNRNYKPSGSANGDLLTLTTDFQHSFFASGSGSCQAPPPPPPPPPPPVEEKSPVLLQYDPLFTINNNEKAGVLSLQSPDVTDIFLQCEGYREDNNINYGDFTFGEVQKGEWLRGRKRIATDVLLTTASPILEAYYKDSLGDYYGKDIAYQLNIFIWIENEES